MRRRKQRASANDQDDTQQQTHKCNKMRRQNDLAAGAALLAALCFLSIGARAHKQHNAAHQHTYLQQPHHQNNQQQQQQQQQSNEFMRPESTNQQHYYLSAPQQQHRRDSSFSGDAYNPFSSEYAARDQERASPDYVGSGDANVAAIEDVDGVPLTRLSANSARGGGGDEESPLIADGVSDTHADDSREAPVERDSFLEAHNTRVRQMHDMFEKRQLHNHNAQHQHQHQQQVPSSQELNPISIGLDPSNGGSPFGMSPFQMGAGVQDGALSRPAAADAAGDGGGGGGLPFGLSPLPHLLGFQSSAFDGPQRGDQSAHSNHHAAMPPPPPPPPQADAADSSASVGQSGGGGGGQKTWPKIFRFTDGRINLAKFEKEKKIMLSNKNQLNGDNHIESAPILFDGRPLKRKSFLILHGGVFPN